jgi:methyl-accepting chemotaxis protein
MEKAKISKEGELVSKLERLSQDSEEVFLRLGEALPRLLNEMNASLEQSESMVRSMEQDDTDGSLRNVVDATREVVNNAATRFAEIHQQDEDFFGRLDNAIGHLDELEEMIAKVKDDSIEMELVSLNAMTVALKSGQAGRAFSYITDELKRLSNRTITLTDEITERGSGLSERFQQYRRSVEDAKRFQEKLFTQFRDRLNASFDAFTAGVDSVVSGLRRIQDDATGVRKPLTAIMQEVQFHDLIRQSVDHVVISIRELEEIDDSASTEAVLDEVTYLTVLPELCQGLLDDIREKLEHSRKTFDERLDDAERQIQEVEDERSRFVQSRIAADTAADSGDNADTGAENDEESLAELFDRASQLLDDLFADLARSLRMKSDISEHGRELMRQVEQLERAFESFSTIITRFHSIDIASRIEVAKQEVLQQMSGTVEQMTRLTNDIDQDVNTSLESTKSFIGYVSEAINGYQEVLSGEDRFVEEFRDSMRRNYHALSEANRGMTSWIGEFAVYTRRFFSVFSETRQDLKRLDELAQEIRDIQQTLREIQDHAQRRQAELLHELGKDDWQIGDERLKSMIERFTIFTHKKQAGELAGFDVEEGAEAGEITFF